MCFRKNGAERMERRKWKESCQDFFLLLLIFNKENTNMCKTNGWFHFFFTSKGQNDLSQKMVFCCKLRRRWWHPTPILLSGKSHGQRSLVGCSPCGHEESDTTEWLHFHFSRSCIGEGNGNPLQCSCLENPRDRGAWWAAVYGVAESDTTEAT